MTSRNLADNRQEKAVQRLDILVSHLTRLHAQHFYSRHLLDALFFGLLVATLTVVALRLLVQPFSVWPVLVLSVVPALLLGMLVARYRQPDKLSVVIEADQRLELKQRLSTAWEFRQASPDADITRALAFQAAGRRLPTVTGVYPFELSRWGMLIPVAAAMLVLASMIDITPRENVPVSATDALLAEEGNRLRAFAQRMQRRAEQRNFPRSNTVAKSLQQLGAGMEAGALLREQALLRLDTMERDIASQRSQAAGEAVNAAEPSEGVDSQAADRLQLLEELGLENLRNKLSEGELRESDRRALDKAADDLADLGVSAETLRQALEQYDSGNTRQLEQILEKLSDAGRKLGDAEQLAKAGGAVARARENLGGESIDQRSVVIRGDSTEGEPADDTESNGAYGSGEFLDQNEGPGSGWGKLISPDDLAGDTMSPSTSLSDDTDVSLTLKGQKGQGSSYQSSTWALPRVGTPGEQIVEVDARFTRQMEAVLAKESYPLHRKEFVRRYFLNLSAGNRQQLSTPAEGQ